MPQLTQERAYEVLRLDIETGRLTWRVTLGSRALAGQEAGCIHQASGYRVVKIDDGVYRAHLIVWLMIYGVWCPRKIDHRDGNRSNNAPSNLRYATESQQRANSGLRSDNTSGHRGVGIHKPSGRFTAETRMEGKRRLKHFDTLEEAVAAAKAFRAELHGKFASTRDSDGRA